jgi:hypothetical protein
MCWCVWTGSMSGKGERRRLHSWRRRIAAEATHCHKLGLRLPGSAVSTAPRQQEQEARRPKLVKSGKPGRRGGVRAAVGSALAEVAAMAGDRTADREFTACRQPATLSDRGAAATLTGLFNTTLRRVCLLPSSVAADPGPDALNSRDNTSPPLFPRVLASRHLSCELIVPSSCLS